MTRNHLQNSANGNFHGNRIRDAAGFFFFGEHTKYKIASGQLHGRVNFAPLSQATQFSWLENESGPSQTFPGPRLGSSGGGAEGALSKIRNISHAGNSPSFGLPLVCPFRFFFFFWVNGILRGRHKESLRRNLCVSVGRADLAPMVRFGLGLRWLRDLQISAYPRLCMT